MMKIVREWGEAILVALVLTIIIRFFVVQAFKIPSSSMENTLLIGDYLLVNKFLYGVPVPFSDEHIFPIRDPERGDVIVFQFPVYEGLQKFRQRNAGVSEEITADWLKQVQGYQKGKVDFIKRVVGVPGDTIEIRNRQVFINGTAYNTPQKVHKDPILTPGTRDNFGPVTVPPDSFFVLGDNRDYSMDSRFWGFVPRDTIRGLAFIKYWSWDTQAFRPRLDRLGRPID